MNSALPDSSTRPRLSNQESSSSFSSIASSTFDSLSQSSSSALSTPSPSLCEPKHLSAPTLSTRDRSTPVPVMASDAVNGANDALEARIASIDLSRSDSATPSQPARTPAASTASTAESRAPLDGQPTGAVSPSIPPSASPQSSSSTISQPSSQAPRPHATHAASAPTPMSPPTANARPIPSTSGIRRAPPTVGGSAGALKAGVRGGAGGAGGPLKMPPSLAAKMAAMTSRTSSGTPAIPSLKPTNPPAPPPVGAAPPALAPRPLPKPGVPTPGRAGGPVVGPGGGMAARRKMGPGLTLSAMGVGAAAEEKKPRRGPPGGMKLNLNGDGELQAGSAGNENVSSPNGGTGKTDAMGTPFSNFRKIVDPSGRLNFAQKAILHADGVDFSSGASFKIKMDDFELFEELGKGNYGTVQKVLHRPTAVTMALKEIRLELDDSKLKTIITELDILHRATSPYIIDFYGAFFIESCVYYCMEFMDAGSLEVVAGIDVPEDVLARITRCMVEGLKFLKDELKIMHRDVKPTNVLLSRNGAVKLCDFGVSGQLDRSLAKTNIGCQSYMAPERIKGESQGAATSYTASSDVWSLGLSIIEAAIGHYPYPPETYSNVFAQLTAIVHGDPPNLPDRYSETARDFVAKCLEKQANRRPTYAQLLEHPWLKENKTQNVDMEGWIAKALAYREKNPRISAPALA
ncbi:uncharacterized protein JCM15063_004973 [Sporobolomyces koalae]|uniref:uncharacterized protein n=1 Tax=Sporobolomyces koalae TaxID=500713 RepID=UPI00316C2D0F